MTYTLFECLKEKLDELMADQPPPAEISPSVASTSASTGATPKEATVKKEQLTKAQKRRQWDASDHMGVKPRGHNWVDIVSHLGQTGDKDERGSVPTNYVGVSVPTNYDG